MSDSVYLAAWGWSDSEDPLRRRLESIRRHRADLQDALARNRLIFELGQGIRRPPSAESRQRQDQGMGRVDQAFSLLGLDPDDVPPPEDIEPMVLRLRRSYSTTDPETLQLRIDARLRQLRQLLRGEGLTGRIRDLREAAAWLMLLRGTAQADMSELEAAHDSVAASRHLAVAIGHAELEAWTWETAAWMAATDGRQRDARDLADRGIQIAPVGSYGLVAVTLQRARVSATLQDARAARADVLAGERAYGAVGEPEWPDDHYSIDRAKVAFFTSGAMAQLRKPVETIEHAAEVVHSNEDPSTHNFWPMRVANARVEWAMALADLGEEDEAESKAMAALDPHWLRPDTERRMEALLARLRDPRIKERLTAALATAKAESVFEITEKRLLFGP